MKDTLISEFCVNACQAAPTDHPYSTSDVCELAHKVLVIMHPGTEHDVEDPEGVFRYTDASQVLFDRYYDEVEDALWAIGLKFNYYNSTWVINKGEKQCQTGAITTPS